MMNAHKQEYGVKEDEKTDAANGDCRHCFLRFGVANIKEYGQGQAQETAKQRAETWVVTE